MQSVCAGQCEGQKLGGSAVVGMLKETMLCLGIMFRVVLNNCVDMLLVFVAASLSRCRP